MPSGKKSSVERIVTFDGDLQSAIRGQSVTLTLRDEIDISRGDVIVSKQSPIKISAQSYLKEFYASHGFIAKGDEYMEDGIPHTAMYLDL